MTDYFKYALVANGTVIICDFQPNQSNARNIAQKLLETIDTRAEKSYGEQGQFVYEVRAEPDKMIYLVITSKDCIPTLRGQFLDDLKRKWRAKFGNRGSTMAAFSQNAVFGPTIELLFGTFNSERSKKMAIAKANIQAAQDQTAQNLSLALERGEQLEIMSVKADKIKDSAKAFHREASKVKSAMCWQKYRCFVFIGLIVAILLFVIITFACGGFSYKNCK
ncbi:Vesicle-associated membrane protein 7B [Tritrichomonas foetus]|uniref:Vesicle-associated membrane protein 7B n=1 Tax=Tritrichomonas foetus TaxID=1144522 RepID=A0A1J4JCZ7_9EUKA|nr:Vesicle-associated membrane protein 7B [Tritrichomonas foetus]|eukprot:OHS96561.1 Vesicle-associated membrane protein 7B [Tritrichomonas foetus]